MEDSFGGSAYIILSKNGLDICFLKSQDGLVLQFGNNAKRTAGREWFSQDILEFYMVKDANINSSPKEETAIFLQKHISKIVGLFSMPVYKDIKNELHLLEKERAKRLFKKKNKTKASK